MIVVPTMVLHRNQTENLRFAPPIVAKPAIAAQAILFHLRAGDWIGNDEAGQMQIRLCLCATLFAKCAQRMRKAVLRPVFGMDEIAKIEAGAVVASERDTAAQVDIVAAEQTIDHTLYWYDGESKIVDQTQIACKRDQIVARVGVARDIIRMPSEDGNTHSPFKLQ